MPGYNNGRDYFASQILNDVLNSQRGALYELQASGKALGTFAQSVTFPESGMSFVGSAVPVTTTGETAVSDLKAVIEGYKKTGLPADLVAVAKQREVSQAEFARNSISGPRVGVEPEPRGRAPHARRRPRRIASGHRRRRQPRAAHVLRPEHRDDGISTPKEAAGSAFGGRQGEDNTVIPTEHTGLPAFARQVLKQLKVPEQTVHPVMQTLPNGLKLIVVPSTISHTAVVRGQVESNPGIQDPAGKEGIDGIVDGLFSFGTTTYDRIAYQTELDKIAATVGAGHSFSLDVLSKDFDRGVELLADDELHPALPAQAFGIVKQQSIGSLTGTLKSPDYKAGRAFVEAVYPANDPARRTATPETVGTVTLDDVKSYYASAYRPDLTTIVVVGDVTPEHARAAIEKSFGAWKATGPKPDLFPPAVPPNKSAQATIPATGRVQSEVRLGEVIPIGYNDPDYPVLQLANTVLSGGFYASLLFHDLRELHGYVYTVGSSLSGGKNRSTFNVNYGADPQNVVARGAAGRRRPHVAAEETAAERPAHARQSADPGRAADPQGVVRRAGRPADPVRVDGPAAGPGPHRRPSAARRDARAHPRRDGQVDSAERLRPHRHRARGEVRLLTAARVAAVVASRHGRSGHGPGTARRDAPA